MRLGNSLMMIRRSSSLYEIQRSISAKERPQPTQCPVAGSIAQIFVQGLSIVDMAGFARTAAT
jgi:hypothetical protein